VAKIGARVGVDFNFTNNQKLKESGFALEGVTVNGYVGKNGITVNVNSQKALNTVVGHEIAHVLEGSNLYEPLSTLITDYAKGKGEYDTRLKQLISTYQNVEGYKGAEGYSAIEKELVADLVGDYLFTDQDFVNRLSTENRSVFTKIFDEIKHLYKLATAGTKEARQLEEVKKMFEEAYRAGSKDMIETRDNSGETKYSLSNLTDTSFTPKEVQAIQGIGKKSINAFNPNDISATKKFAQRYWKEIGPKSPFYRAWFGDWRANDTSIIQIATKQGDTRVDHINKDTGWIIRNSGKVHDETKMHHSIRNRAAVPYLPYIDEIIENAVLLNTEGIGKKKSENSLLMHYMYAVADIGNGPEVLKLGVEEMYNPAQKKTGQRAYALHNIEKAFVARGGVQGNSPSSGSNATNAINTVADLFALVKRMDNDFVPNESSKIVNADGTPKVMYHGSPAQFSVFDKRKAKSSGLYGRGFYFTDSKEQASVYGNQYSVYLDVKHPLQQGTKRVTRKQVRKFLEAVADNEDYSIENYGTYDVDAVLKTVMGSSKNIDAFQVIQDINTTAIGDMVEAATLFNDVNGTQFDGIIVPTETVVFRPEQIKSATDNIGTFDGNNPDIRYSLTEDSNIPIRDPSRWEIRGEDVEAADIPIREDLRARTDSTEAKARDAAYTSAVQRGDMDTARRLVDEAAEAAGVRKLPGGGTVSYYHPAGKSFRGFETEKTRYGNLGYGYYLTPNGKYAAGTGTPVKMYLLPARLATENDRQITPAQVQTAADRFGVNISPSELKGKGDSRILQTLMDKIVAKTNTPATKLLPAFRQLFPYDGIQTQTETALWDPALLQSADPVVYDEGGEVIPLSQRYDWKNGVAVEDRVNSEKPNSEQKGSGIGIKLKTPGNYGEKAIPYSERGIEIEERIAAYLDSLKQDGDFIERPAGELQKQDLAILTTETGVEHSMLTISGKTYLIRGAEKQTTIPEKMVRMLMEHRGTLDCHSHPFIGDLIPSKSDKELMKKLTWQEESVIIDPTQTVAVYTSEGVKYISDEKPSRTEAYYQDIFGGD